MSAEAQRRYNLRHPGRHAATVRRYRARNPAYVQKDREAARERMRRYSATAAGILADVKHNATRRESREAQGRS